MSSATSKLIAIFRSKMGDCSDQQLGKELKVHWGLIRQFADGKKQLSGYLLERVCKLVDEDVAAWRAKIAADETAPACTIPALLIELLREKKGGVSDLQLAKELGVTPTSIARWRNGEQQMSNDTAIRIAVMCDENPHTWLLRNQMDREDPNSPTVQAWRWFLGMVPDGKKIAGILLAGCAMLAHVDDARASGNLVVSAHSPAAADVREHCILCQIMAAVRRRLARWLARLFAPPHAYTPRAGLVGA